MKKTYLSRRQVLQGMLAATGVGVVGPHLGLSAGAELPPRSSHEWTFEEAQKYWQPMNRAVQHVGVPGHEWQAGVLWNGALVFGPLKYARENPGMVKELALLGDNALHISVGYGKSPRFVGRIGGPNPALTRSNEAGYLPIPSIETKDGDLTWKQTVFAHLLDQDFDQALHPKEEHLLVVHSRFTVRNNSADKSEAHLWFHFGNTSQVVFGYKAGQGNELGSSIAHKFVSPWGFIENEVRYVVPAPKKGAVSWHENIDPPAEMQMQATKILEWMVSLGPGEEASLDLRVPYKTVPRQTGRRILDLDWDQLHDRTLHFWEGVVAQAGSIVTPNPFVNDYVTAVAGQMSQQVGYRHKSNVWMYKTSPNHYEMYWPCNAAKALPTLDLRGLTQYSRPVLQSFIDTQTDDIGKLTREKMGEGDVVTGEGFDKRPGFMGNFGDWTANTLLLSHGLELWALASHYRIMRDRKWLGDGHGSPLQAMLDACDWTLAQRRRTMREEKGKKVPHWGLLPAASAHDWLWGNTIFNDAFCIFGIIETVRVLREISHPRAEELATALNEYRACLRDRYVEARDKARPLPMPDGKLMPYVPRDVYELDWAKTDWTYTTFGPLRAGAWGAIDPHDELIDQSLAFVETGMPKGDGYYLELVKNEFGQLTADENFRDVNDPASSRHFLLRHFVEYETMWPIGFDLFLQRDDLPRFFEWFFHNLSMVIHKSYRVGVESLEGVPSCAPGDGERWRAVRNMFVNERGGYDGSQQSLWLMQAIPRSWLKSGERMAVHKMGTHFGGQVDLETEVGKDGTSVRVQANVDLAVLPTEIRMRLRSGNGQPLKSATINGTETTVLESDTIALPQQLKGNYRIDARFV
jgi:hypothetical protein